MNQENCKKQNKKAYFQKFKLIPKLSLKVMHYVHWHSSMYISVLNEVLYTRLHAKKKKKKKKFSFHKEKISV